MKKFIILFLLSSFSLTYSTDTEEATEITRVEDVSLWDKTWECTEPETYFAAFTQVYGEETAKQTVVALSTLCFEVDEYKKELEELAKNTSKVKKLGKKYLMSF